MNDNNATDPTNHNAEQANTAEHKAEQAGMNDPEPAEQEAKNHTLCVARLILS